MTIEQKAKAYDEVVNKLKGFIMQGVDPLITRADAQDFFPELRESEDEDEKIRKAIHIYLDWLDGRRDYQPKGEYTIKDMIAWLEKQGQVKESFVSQHEIETCKENNVSLTSEDERIRKECIDIINAWDKSCRLQGDYCEAASSCITWLEKQGKQSFAIRWHDVSLIPREMKELLRTEYEKGRADAITETQVAWSEEDEKMLNRLIGVLDGTNKEDYNEDWENIFLPWLKSLRPHNWTKEDKERYISCLQRLSTGNPEQPETINSKWFKEHVYPQKQWKPSKEQIDALDSTLQYSQVSHNSFEHLNSLYNDLKKLKEE